MTFAENMRKRMELDRKEKLFRPAVAPMKIRSLPRNGLIFRLQRLTLWLARKNDNDRQAGHYLLLNLWNQFRDGVDRYGLRQGHWY